MRLSRLAVREVVRCALQPPKTSRICVVAMLLRLFLLQYLLDASVSGFECTGLCAFPVNGYCYNLSAFAGLKLSGPEAMHDSAHYELSLCGNLTKPCIDSLTGVRIFGYLYTFFGKFNSMNHDRSVKESHCWDVLSRFVSPIFSCLCSYLIARHVH